MKKKIIAEIFECKECHQSVGLNPENPIFEKCPYCGGDFKEETKIKENEIEIPEENTDKKEDEEAVVQVIAPCCWFAYCPIHPDYYMITYNYHGGGNSTCGICGTSLLWTATTCSGWF